MAVGVHHHTPTSCLFQVTFMQPERPRLTRTHSTEAPHWAWMAEGASPRLCPSRAHRPEDFPFLMGTMRKGASRTPRAGWGQMRQKSAEPPLRAGIGRRVTSVEGVLFKECMLFTRYP